MLTIAGSGELKSVDPDTMASDPHCFLAIG